MKNKVILFSFFTFALLTSCKKNNTEPETETETTVVSHPVGYLRNYQAFNILASNLPLKKTYSASAYFYSDSTVSDLVNVDSVSLNKVYLQVRTNKTYFSYDSVSGSESNWHVKGNNGVSSFDYTFIMPSYASYNLLPDSINLKKDLTISTIDILNVTKGSITISDNLGKNISKDWKPGITSITFTAAEFAYLHQSTFYLYINLYNQLAAQRVNGKLLNFENQLSIDKYLYTY